MSKLRIVLLVVVGCAILLAIALVTVFLEGRAADKLISVAQMTALLVIPYVFIFDLGGLRSRLPLFRDRNLGRSVVGYSLFAVAWVLLCAGLIGVTEGYRSDEYRAAVQARVDAIAAIDAEREAARLAAAENNSGVAPSPEIVPIISTTALDEPVSVPPDDVGSAAIPNTPGASSPEPPPQTTAPLPESPPPQAPEPAPNPSPTVNLLSLASGITIPELYPERVSLVEPYSFSVGGLDFQIIGCAYGHDAGRPDLGLNIDEAMGLAFLIGLHKGMTDLGNRDALLALYVTATPGASVASPRDVPFIGFDAAVADDRGDAGVFIVNTLQDESPVVGRLLYGVVLFGVYSDAEYFDIVIADETVRLEASLLPFLK